MKSEKRFYTAIISLLAVTTLLLIFQFSEVRILFNDYLIFALSFRIFLIAVYSFLLAIMALNYQKFRGTVIRYLLTSIATFFMAYIGELFYVVGINSRIDEKSLRYLLLLLFICIAIGQLSFMLFIVRITDPRTPLKILWPPVFYIGVISSYLIVGDENMGYSVFNAEVSMYQLDYRPHSFIQWTMIINSVYVGVYILAHIIPRSRSKDKYSRRRYSVITGVIATYLGTGLIYSINSTIPVGFSRYLYQEFFINTYLITFIFILFLPYIVDTKFVRFFALGIEHLYIVGQDGLPYLSLKFGDKHKMSDEMLVSAAISAIQSIMYDIGMGFSPLRKIELEERKILFYSGIEYIYALVTSEVTSFLEDIMLVMCIELDELCSRIPREMISYDPQVKEIILQSLGIYTHQSD